MKKLLSVILVCILVISGFGTVALSIKNIKTEMEQQVLTLDDCDPFVDIVITINITAIRFLDIIDASSDPDFFVKMFINDAEFISPIWNDTSCLYDYWSVEKNVPDDEEFVTVRIQLWDFNDDGEVLCDIGDVNDDVELSYSIKTGHWIGDDYLEDPSGYGRLNGCDDGSIYEHQRDCELWFEIYQIDFDGDGIPYWTEVNIYGTDPEVDNTGEDEDSDGCPIEWEYKWEYDPYLWDDHERLDPDGDSLNNLEEYLTRALGSDPFRRDLFLEIDYMEEGPNGEQSIVSEDTVELLKNPYHRRNIVFYLDIGDENGGEIIPFDNETDQNEVIAIYNEYFSHNGTDNWRRSVFHYGMFVYLCKPNGYAFGGDGSPFWGYGPGTNSFVIASKNMERLSDKTLKPLSYIYASSIMHEMGHNFGIRWGHPFGCDARFSYKPWQIGFWLYFNYKSIMNYIYTYSILDYSDGSHGRRDYNDWANIDLAHFEIPNDSNRGILNSLNNNGEWIQEIGNNGGIITGGFGTSSNMATRGIEIYKGEIYIGTQNFDIEKLRIFYPKIWVTIGLMVYKIFENYGQNRILLKTINLGLPFHGLFGKGCDIWKYNHTNDQWIPIISATEGALLPSGFGHHHNFGAAIIKSFQDNLYVGTSASSTSGCEIWRWNGLDWEMMMEGGFGDRFNSGAWSVAEYNDELYLGTMNWNTGCQIWKTGDGENWEKVALPGGDGFGTNWNVYAWSMGIFNDSLYVGTCNINRSQGCQLWRFDGSQWFKMNLPGGDGFGEPDNYGIRNIIEYKEEMYVSTATNYVHSDAACEIWRYDGNEWYSLVGDEADLSDGFGNLYNKYAWSMIKTSDDKLMVGTFNIQPLTNGVPFDTYGCEIWTYDGYNWTELAGENGSDQVDGGFGNRFNFGARSMIEYPENSGIIWVGTWNMDVNNFKIFTGCEIWRRI